MRIFLVYYFIVLGLLFSKAATVTNPRFDRTDVPAFHITKVEVTKDTTFVYCILYPESGDWANISRNTILRDTETGEEFPIYKSVGVPFSPQKRTFTSSEQCELLFCFPSIKDSKRIDFIEEKNVEAFNLYGIDLEQEYDTIYRESDLSRFFNRASFYDTAGDTIKAILYKEKEKNAAEYIYGIRSEALLACMTNLSFMYDRYGLYDNAINMMEALMIRYAGILEKSDRNYALRLRSLAQFYFHAQKYDLAISKYKEAIALFETLGITDNECASIHFEIGVAYMQLMDIMNAKKWFDSSYDIFSNLDEKEKNIYYGRLLNNMSNLYSLYITDYNLAYKYALEAVQVNSFICGKESEAYISALAVLSNAEFGLNMTNEGLKHLEEAVCLLDIVNTGENFKQQLREKLEFVHQSLNIKKSSDGINSSKRKTDNSLFLEATNLYAHGDVMTAILGLYEYKSYIEKNWNINTMANYNLAISSLSNLLIEEGHYTEADSVLDNSIYFIQTHNVPSSISRGIYHAKGYLYYTMNNIDMALHWYNMAKNLFSEKDNMGLEYALLLSNMSLCYINIKEISTAKQLSDKAYNMCIQFYGDKADNAISRLLILNNLASIYFILKDFSKAKELLEEVVKNCVSNQHEKTKALALENLSEYYLFIEQNHNKAEECLLQVSEMNADSYVKDMAEFDMCFLHCLTHNDSAIVEIGKYDESIKKHMADMFSYFSEAEREDYWRQKSRVLVLLNNLALSIFNNNQIKIMAYDNALFTKNMVLNSGRLLENIVKNSAEDTKDAYSDMQALKDMLFKKGMPKDSINIYREKVSKLEKKIVSSIPNFSDKLKQQFKLTNDVKDMLSDSEVAIEFVFLPQINYPLEKSELLYGALILTKDCDAPHFVPLCSESDLKNLLDEERSNNQDLVDKLYDIKDTRLYDKVWASIDPYIQKGKTIYCSPIGYISKINLPAISNGNDRLQDKLEIHVVSTTATIGELKEKKTNEINNSVLFGDINYYEDVDVMKENAKSYQYVSSGNMPTSRSLNRSTWDLLPSTKDEIINISKLLSDKGIRTQTISQNSANEESFKAMNGNAPDIIHVASHGFYYQSIKNITSSFFSSLNSYTYEDFSLSFSGLLFAGANNAWTGENIAEGIEDGILTADEIARLDLKGNKLLVLSACDTGLGNIEIDGVYGLQRGFKKAGAATILMSLWKVPDEETNILMNSFYEHYISGDTPRNSLKQAQNKLIQMGKSPYYWAGFVVLD